MYIEERRDCIEFDKGISRCELEWSSDGGQNQISQQTNEFETKYTYDLSYKFMSEIKLQIWSNFCFKIDIYPSCVKRY